MSGSHFQRCAQKKFTKIVRTRFDGSVVIAPIITWSVLTILLAMRPNFKSFKILALDHLIVMAVQNVLEQEVDEELKQEWLRENMWFDSKLAVIAEAERDEQRVCPFFAKGVFSLWFILFGHLSDSQGSATTRRAAVGCTLACLNSASATSPATRPSKPKPTC
jgi:hypothetical protein